MVEVSIVTSAVPSDVVTSLVENAWRLPAKREVYPLGKELAAKSALARNQFWTIADLPDVSVSVMEGAVTVAVDEGKLSPALVFPPMGDDVLLPVNTADAIVPLPPSAQLPDVWFVAVAIV